MENQIDRNVCVSAPDKSYFITFIQKSVIFNIAIKHFCTLICNIAHNNLIHPEILKGKLTGVVKSLMADKVLPNSCWLPACNMSVWRWRSSLHMSVKAFFKYQTFTWSFQENENVQKCFYFNSCKVPLPTDWATKYDLTFLTEMKLRPETSSEWCDSTEDNHKTCSASVFMFHKTNDVVKQVNR